MKRIQHSVVIIITALVFIGISGMASAALITLDFENLSYSGTLADNYAPDGYTGPQLTWDSGNSLKPWKYYDWMDEPYNPIAGNEVIYSHNYGGSIEFSAPVTFYGSWVVTSDADTNDPLAQEVYWEGYRSDGSTVTSTSLYGGDAGWIEVFWNDVTEVRFVSSSFNHFILDDISFDTEQDTTDPGPSHETSPVAEPATLILLGTGLLGLAGFRKRNR